MTHPAAWTCRACGCLLGRVHGGMLRPLVPIASVDGRGVARLRCPRCGATRHWFPSGASAAVAGHQRPPDRPG